MLLRFAIKKRLYSRPPQYTRWCSFESTLGPRRVRRGESLGPNYSCRISAVLTFKPDCYTGADRRLPPGPFRKTPAAPPGGEKLPFNEVDRQGRKRSSAGIAPNRAPFCDILLH